MQPKGFTKDSNVLQSSSITQSCSPARSESKIYVSEVTREWFWQGWEGIRLCHLKCKIIFAFSGSHTWRGSRLPCQQKPHTAQLVRQGAASRAEPAAAVQPFETESVKAQGWKAPWDITQSKPHTETGCKTSRLSLTDVSLTLS